MSIEMRYSKIVSLQKKITDTHRKRQAMKKQ